MQAEVHLLHRSDFYEIRDYRCTCMECSISSRELCDSFCLCFVRKGFYEQRTFRRDNPMHIGRLLVTKPGTEYVVRHIDNQPDLCTSLSFSDSFYGLINDYFKSETRWFFGNPDIQSLLISTNPEIDLLHHQILEKAPQGLGLETDELVIRLVERVAETLGNVQSPAPISESLKRHHLVTIEKAKDYLFRHFDGPVSLQELSQHCCVSLFHFVRIFKAILGISPHQYLTELRLNHARLLLTTTSHPITQVAFECGFNSLEHFVTAYRKQFHAAPSVDRKRGPKRTLLVNPN